MEFSLLFSATDARIMAQALRRLVDTAQTEEVRHDAQELLDHIGIMASAHGVEIDQPIMFFSVNGEEPSTLKEIIAANNEPGCEPLTPGEVMDLEQLKVGETYYLGQSDIKRLS